MAATKLTVADVFSRAHLSPQLASFEKKSEYKGKFMAANPLQDMERELDDLKSVTAYLKSNFTRDFYPQVAADAKDKKRLQQIFKTADTNQDGVIDKREFMNNVLICLFQSVDRVVLKGACKNAVAAEDAKTMKRLPSLETQGTSMPLRMPDVCEEEESKIGGQTSVIGVALVRPPRPVGIPARPSGPRRGGATA